MSHTLEFSLEGNSHRAASQLLSGVGYVAVVTLRTGEKLLVGYSERFRAEQPLYCTLDFDSRTAPAQRPRCRVVLSSTDADMANAVVCMPTLV